MTSLAALVLVLLLNLSEYWHKATPWDVWAADKVAQGLLVASAPFWARHRGAAGMALVFGVARAGCTAMWPDASDAGGSICDAQTGLPLTIGLLGAACWTAGRLTRG